MSYKNLTKDDVKRVAEALIKINGTTTTKDVKDQLRAEGYFAKQGGVSEMMATICDEETDWQYSFNGTYREYVIDGVHTASGPSASQALATHVGATAQSINVPVTTSKSNANSVFGKSYTTKDGEQIDAIDKPSVGDWACRDANVIKDTLYFDGNVSKDRARYAYCKIAGVPHNDARIARHK
jgi:hypothetical protein